MKVQQPVVGGAAEYIKAMVAAAEGLDVASIDRYVDLVYEAWCARSQVFVIGNGGSASTAQHHATDLVKTAAVGGVEAVRCTSLTDNVGLLTAIANDRSYVEIFTYLLESQSSPGDLVVALSCSGTSPNVVAACTWARANDRKVVALTGADGGEIGKLADHWIAVPSENFGIIEDLHLSLGHIAAQLLHGRFRFEQPET